MPRAVRLVVQSRGRSVVNDPEPRWGALGPCAQGRHEDTLAPSGRELFAHERAFHAADRGIRLGVELLPDSGLVRPC